MVIIVATRSMSGEKQLIRVYFAKSAEDAIDAVTHEMPNQRVTLAGVPAVEA